MRRKIGKEPWASKDFGSIEVPLARQGRGRRVYAYQIEPIEYEGLHPDMGISFDEWYKDNNMSELPWDRESMKDLYTLNMEEATIPFPVPRGPMVQLVAFFGREEGWSCYEKEHLVPSYKYKGHLWVLGSGPRGEYPPI